LIVKKGDVSFGRLFTFHIEAPKGLLKLEQSLNKLKIDLDGLIVPVIRDDNRNKVAATEAEPLTKRNSP